MAWRSSSKCPAPALSSSLVHHPRRRIRCCEDTLGVPLRRHRAQQQQHQLLFPEHAAAAGQYQRQQRSADSSSAADVYDRITGFTGRQVQPPGSPHQAADELREFGLTDEMLHDQLWQKTANIGELNYYFMTHHQSFFDE